VFAGSAGYFFAPEGCCNLFVVAERLGHSWNGINAGIAPKGGSTTSKTDNAKDRPPWEREVVIPNPRYAGAKSPGDVVQAMARFKRPPRNRTGRGKKPVAWSPI